MNRTPALFLGHGSPMNAIEADNPFNTGFKQVAEKFPKPRAILIWHFALAQKLKPLREQGVSIVGSGNIVHNLRTISFAHIRRPGAAYEWAETFRNSINQAILNGDNETLVRYPSLGESAALSVPTPEHYLPLLYIMALRDEKDKVELFNDEMVGGSLSMTSVLLI